MTSPVDDKSASESADFDALVEEHSGFVYKLAFRMMGNNEEAEDVAQDAFLSAYRAWDRFRGDSRVTTWLYRITTNAALMRLRKTKKTRTLVETGVEDHEIVDWSASPEREARNAELRDKLKEGINSLEPDLKAAVVLRDVQGLSNTEASEALDISVPALKSRLHRARVLLRQFLTDYVAETQ